MSDIDIDAVKAKLRDIDDPHTGAPLGDAVQAVAINGDKAAVHIRLGYPAAGWRGDLEATIRQRLDGLELAGLTVEIDWTIAEHAVQGGLAPLAGVKNIIAVASGKGGVGKSTIAANLALALQAEGARVGVLDADIYGPSQPRLLGLSGQPETTPERRILPIQAHGLQAMSIGVLVAVDQAMIWRGPMASQALSQMTSETLWQDLDYLIIDLPPGTGDIQLTLAQRIPVAASLIVTTPQEIALDDVRRAVAMFNKVKVPVLGIVENMSTHICSSCGFEDSVFGHGGGARMARETGLALLGEVPLEAAIGEATDAGTPIVAAAPDSAAAQRFRQIARNTAGRLARQSRNTQIRMPKIRITE